jgi:hypothetical protein
MHIKSTPVRRVQAYLDVHHVKAAVVEPRRNGKGAQHRAQQGKECVDHAVVLLGQQDVVGVGFMLLSCFNAGQGTVERRPAQGNSTAKGQ